MTRCKVSFDSHRSRRLAAAAVPTGTSSEGRWSCRAGQSDNAQTDPFGFVPPHRKCGREVRVRVDHQRARRRSWSCRRRPPGHDDADALVVPVGTGVGVGAVSDADRLSERRIDRRRLDIWQAGPSSLLLHVSLDQDGRLPRVGFDEGRAVVGG
jgi:hypothetical protein